MLASHLEAALSFYNFGLKVVPLSCDLARERWWLDDVDAKNLRDHWTPRPDEEVGFCPGDSQIVFETATPLATAALRLLESQYACIPAFVIGTQSGEVHVFRQPSSLLVDASEARAHRAHIAIHFGECVVALPPSQGATLKKLTASSAEELPAVTQEFVAAARRHNEEPPPNPLDVYSLRGRADELLRLAVDQRFVIPLLVIVGQSTVLFGAPNAGKTLVMLGLLCAAIAAGLVDPDAVFYVNVDDTGRGLALKAGLADEYGFHMLSDGMRGFEPNKFLALLDCMAQSGQAYGIVVILDTAKRFVDLMDKRRASEFTQRIRRFVLAGGTVIALAHVNKHDRDGEPVYAGTSDLVDDFDCAYTLKLIPGPDANTKVVTFKNIKRRGDVALEAAYSYSAASAIDYAELVASVQLFDREDFERLKVVANAVPDVAVIRCIEACIAQGVLTKMLLAEAASKRAAVSRRVALHVVERYTGSDPKRHRWSFAIRARGAKEFALLAGAAPLPLDLPAPT